VSNRYEIRFADGWYPIDLIWSGTTPLVKFAKSEDIDLSNAFFHQEFEGAEHRLTVPLDDLDIDYGAYQLRPVYFIYHSGRCGSTLATRMLNELPGLRVYSEPLALNLILEPPNDIAPAELRERFHKVAVLMDLATPARFESLVVKWATWTLLSDQLVRSVMKPRATAFLWRDPVETLVSELANRPLWLNASGIELLFRRHAPDFQPKCVGADAESTSRLLGALFAAAARLPRDTLFMDYPALPESIIDTLCPHMDRTPDDETKDRMRQLARFDAKANQAVEFHSDSEDKRNRASADIIYFAERYAYPELSKLQDLVQNR